MTINNPITGSIDDLIQINFERMSAFDKASRLVADEELKNYFESRAGESERHIEELQAARPVSGGIAKKLQHSILLPACRVFDNAVYRKKFNAIIESARCVEKYMLDWYDKINDGLSNIPVDIEKLIKQQLTNLKKGQLELNQLTGTLG